MLAAPALLLARPGRAQAPLPVLASFSILGDLAREVGAGRIALATIAGPETDPHGLQPRPSDAAAARAARLAIRNGWGFDPWFDRLLRASGFAGTAVTATEGITPREIAQTPGHNHGTRDPHAWQDVGHAARMAATIAAGLAAADPAGAEPYRAALAGYAARLATLDAWVVAEIARVPAPRRVIVTSHDAFGYFAARYGVRVLAALGAAKGGEPSAQAIAQLIRQIRAERITAIFVEAAGSATTLERLAREAGVRPGGRLFADTLSAPDGPAASYEAMMRHNVGLMVGAMLD